MHIAAHNIQASILLVCERQEVRHKNEIKLYKLELQFPYNINNYFMEMFRLTIHNAFVS